MGVKAPLIFAKSSPVAFSNFLGLPIEGVELEILGLLNKMKERRELKAQAGKGKGSENSKLDCEWLQFVNQVKTFNHGFKNRNRTGRGPTGWTFNHDFKNRTGPAGWTANRSSFRFGPVIRPDGDRTGIGLLEPAVQPVNRTNQPREKEGYRVSHLIPKGGPSLFARNKDTKKVGGDSEELKGEKCLEWELGCIKDGFVWVFSGVYIPSSRRERESLKAELEQSEGFEMILSVGAAPLDVEIIQPNYVKGRKHPIQVGNKVVEGRGFKDLLKCGGWGIISKGEWGEGGGIPSVAYRYLSLFQGHTKSNDSLLKLDTYVTQNYLLVENKPRENVANVKDLALELGCMVGELPTTYLGLPLEIVVGEIQKDFLQGGKALEKKMHLINGQLSTRSNEKEVRALDTFLHLIELYKESGIGDMLQKEKLLGKKSFRANMGREGGVVLIK
ncbi:hypothetical protein CK203_051033 [Vitis vinifera]|uniref:DUF4283 domain-containing protein n=1 Tax=Vitis vinifera TaxID=29760 RepID=A0A438GPX6_VITVI|nr:hypothetical protein CK203_051033 [Vitis vinifera]